MSVIINPYSDELVRRFETEEKRLRVILGNDDCWYQFNFTPDEVEVKKGNPAHIGMICVIGSQIDTHDIKHLF